MSLIPSPTQEYESSKYVFCLGQESEFYVTNVFTALFVIFYFWGFGYS